MDFLNNIFNNSKKENEQLLVLQKNLSKANAVNESLQERLSEKDLDIRKADKSIQKIIQTWKNINSSESLTKILYTIINGLSTDLDFLYCLLFQVHTGKEGTRLKVVLNSEVAYFNIDEILDNKLKKLNIPYAAGDNPLIMSIKNQETRQVEKFHDIFKNSDLTMDKLKIDKLESIFIDRAIIVQPLMVQGNPFGCLVAVSLKEEVDSMDKNYLKLFAGQIELSVSMTRLLDSVKTQAVTDVLTGLYNRRYFNEALSKEVKKSLRTQRPFTLITLDLDHLKKINDFHGHSAGDAAIAAIGSVLLKCGRESDVPARFGGEEFALILPDTDTEGGMNVAERVRAAIAEKQIQGVGNISASLGVATFLKHAYKLEDLLEIVDKAMYVAKENGRNRVELAKAVLSAEGKSE